MRYSIFISAIVLFFCSCSGNHQKELAAFRQNTNSLERSSKTMMLASEDIRKMISEKVNELSYSSRPLIWYSKATRFSTISTHVIEYINQLKSTLIDANGKDMNAVIASADFKAVDKIFIKEQKGNELFKALKAFIDSARKIDWELDSMTTVQLIKDYDYLDTSTIGSVEFTNTFFADASVASALSLLAKFENDIRNTEQQFVKYCYNMTSPGCILRYERFQAIIGQSSNCIKAGGNMEITAGIGSFSREAVPMFFVDGKAIGCDVDGVMTYKFKTPVKAGKYAKPVKIEYTKPDGTKESREYSIEYTVIDPNQK